MLKISKKRFLFFFSGFKISEENLAKPEQFPWVISLTDTVDYITCSGTIVSPRHVLTAAHCVNKYENATIPCGKAWAVPKQYYVSYGEVCSKPDKISCSKRDMKHVAVKKYIYLNKFHTDKCQNGDDLVIFELEKDLEFDDFTRPICITNDNIQNFYDLMDLGFDKDEC